MKNNKINILIQNIKNKDKKILITKAKNLIDHKVK